MGLADSRLAGSDFGEVVELYLRQADAAAALREVLEDEPAWQGQLRIVTLDDGTADTLAKLVAKCPAC